MSTIDLEQLTESQPSRVFGLSKSQGQPAIFPSLILKKNSLVLVVSFENLHLHLLYSHQRIAGVHIRVGTENHEVHCNFYSWPRACDWLWKWEWLTRRNNFGSKHCCHNNFCLTSHSTHYTHYTHCATLHCSNEHFTKQKQTSHCRHIHFCPSSLKIALCASYTLNSKMHSTAVFIVHTL